MHRGGRHAAIPHRLAIIVSVDIDETRRDQLAPRIEFVGAVFHDRADGRDAAAFDADIGLDRRASRAIDYATAPNDEVEFCCHRTPPSHRAALWNSRHGSSPLRLSHQPTGASVGVRAGVGRNVIMIAAAPSPTPKELIYSHA